MFKKKMSGYYLLIVNGNVRWFVDSAPILESMSDLYEQQIQMHTKNGCTIEYQKTSIISEKEFNLLQTRANSLVDRLNHGEMLLGTITEEMTKKKDHHRK